MEFYQSQKYEYLGTMDGLCWYWRSLDKSAMAGFSFFNLYSGAEKETGEKVATGPILVIYPNIKIAALEKTSTENPLPEALKKCGMTKEDFDKVEQALMIAYRDSHNETDFTPQEYIKFPPDTPKDQVDAYKASVDDSNEVLAARKANLEVYQKNSRVLDEVIKQLMPGQ